MAGLKRHNIYIYDHPESKLRFLEETLHGKDWRATLVYPENTPEERQRQREAMEAFTKRGYQVRATTNEFGQHVLELHHLGEGSSPADLVREMGLARGVGHMITNPSIPVAAGLHKLGGAFDYLVKTVKDPAHANGMIYLVAEAFLFGITKDKKAEIPDAFDAKPGKLWRKMGFGLFLAQSLTYLFLAKSNDDTSFNEFKNKISKTIKKGGNLTEVHYDETADKPATGPSETLIRMLRRYPIEAGALFNNLGMGLYIAGAFKDRAFAKTLGSPKAKDYLASGFKNDRNGALTSIAAWFLMLIKPKEKQPFTSDATESTNPFARAWNGLRENPQIGTGLLTIAASTQRLAGAKNRGDHSQTIGEGIYLLGDLALLFTKNDHYGKKTGNIDTLANGLAEYINKMPLILGPKSQHEMVCNMSNFLLQKGLAEIKHHPRTASFTPEELKERADLMILEVGRRVKNSYNEQMEQLGDVTARLITQFPASQHAVLLEQLATALSKFSWVYASPEELKPVLAHSLAKLPPAVSQAATQSPTMDALRQPVLDIANLMEEVKDASSVAMLYDVLAPLSGRAKEAPAITAHAPAKPATTVTQASRVAPVAANAAALAHAY